MSVYFAQPMGQPVDPIKIGFSENVQRRFVELERQHGCAMNLLALCDGGRRLEKALHLIFEPYRVSGEWFEPADDILRLIEDIKINGPKAVPSMQEDAPAVGIRADLIRDEASELVRAIGGVHGSAKEQIMVAASKTGLSPTVIERIRYKKSERIYADIMDALRITLANELEAVSSADLFTLKRHIARLKLTTPMLRRQAADLGAYLDPQGER